MNDYTRYNSWELSSIIAKHLIVRHRAPFCGYYYRNFVQCNFVGILIIGTHQQQLM